MSGSKNKRPSRSPRPREFLSQAEDIAVRIRKLLRARKSAAEDPERLGKQDDAIRLAVLVEQIARKGQARPAAKAIEIAEYIERLLDMLWTEVDNLLVS